MVKYFLHEVEILLQQPDSKINENFHSMLTRKNLKIVQHNKENIYTLSSRYAAWYWGYLPPAPPKASCQVSMRINIFSLTFRSGCKRKLSQDKVLEPNINM